MNQKEIKEFIRSLKTKKDLTELDVYECKEKEDYIYYFSISGFLEDEYFCIYFMKYKRSKETEQYISKATDNPELIKKLFELEIEIK